jgi:hypothetical protein
MNESFPYYDEGDVIEVFENKYIIDQVDYKHKLDRVLQYRTERLDEDSPPITLIPDYSLEKFAVKIFREADPEDITVIEE